jgi:hypoxanthine phosphoribosyltransferase
MSETIINRANSKIGASDFVKLTQLHLDYEWLTYEPEALFELWCLSENNEQQDLIEHLIKNFSFINGRNLNESSRTLSSHIESEWDLKPNNTFLVATCGDAKPDGSQSIIQVLKNKFSVNWKESNFFNSLPIGANEIPDNSNIVLVDDFIGTGDTISRKLKYVNETIEKRELQNVTVRIISLAAMEFSKDILNNLKVDYYSVYWLKKGINELIEEAGRESATQSMVELENKLQKRYQGKKLPNFGYKGSEALYALEANNIPNNVFPIFWWPFYKGGHLRKTFFSRI